MKCTCVCRWRQEVSVEYSRRQQHVLWVALAAAGGAEWSGPPQCPAHLPHHCRHRSGERCRQASGHSCQPCCHWEHPQDRQGGESWALGGCAVNVCHGKHLLSLVLDHRAAFFFFAALIVTTYNMLCKSIIFFVLTIKFFSVPDKHLKAKKGSLDFTACKDFMLAMWKQENGDVRRAAMG